MAISDTYGKKFDKSVGNEEIKEELPIILFSKNKIRDDDSVNSRGMNWIAYWIKHDPIPLAMKSLFNPGRQMAILIQFLWMGIRWKRLT